MDLTETTHSNRSGIMYTQNTIYCDSDCYSPSGTLHSAPSSHGDARSGERINDHSTHSPIHVGCTSLDEGTTSSLALASMPVFSATDQSLESMVDLVDIQPPPHVINYWFDRLGLSLDPTSSRSGNPSDSVGFLFPFPPLDGNDYVSLFLGIPCCVTPFGPTYDLG